MRTERPSQLADQLKRVPAEPLPQTPRVPTLIEKIVDDLLAGTGHDTELTQHLGNPKPR